VRLFDPLCVWGSLEGTPSIERCIQSGKVALVGGVIEWSGSLHSFKFPSIFNKSAQLNKHNLLGMSLEDLAIDSIADLFEWDGNGAFEGTNTSCINSSMKMSRLV
jgi:hypothetical protein